MKTCSKCGEEKPLTEFSEGKPRRDGLQTWCKACVSAYQTNRYASDTEFRENRKEESRAAYIRRQSTDPAYRERRKAYFKARYAAMKKLQPQSDEPARLAHGVPKRRQEGHWPTNTTASLRN